MALENARLYRDAVRARETLEAWLNSLPDVVSIVDRRRYHPVPEQGGC